jgi:hypothetical protein
MAQLKVDKGGILAPGQSPGCLSSATLELSGQYQAEIGGTEACTGYDQMRVKGAVTISGTLAVSVVKAFKPKATQSFTIINQDGQGTVKGTFTGMAEGTRFKSGDVSFIISYKGGDGNDVVLTVPNDDKLSAGAEAAKNTPKKKPSLLATWFWPGLGLVVAAFIAGTVVVVRQRRRQTKPKPAGDIPG